MGERDEPDDAMIAAGVAVFHTWDSRFEEPEGFVTRLFQSMQKARENQDSSPYP